MVCAMLYCLAWIYNRDAPEHPYIHYYNRRLCCPVQRPAWRWYLGIGGSAELDGMPSSAAQAAYVAAVLRTLERVESTETHL